MGVSQIELELKDIMNEYSAEFQRKVEKMCKEVSNACTEELRQTSPSGDGKSSKYKDGWKAVKTTERDKVHYAVANQNKPGLTHLLEKGHVVRNATGTYGRTPPNPHISRAEQKYTAEYLRRVQTEL